MNNTNNNYCVILAGGKGRRLWPCSRESKPKQFIDFFGSGRTQLQQTYDRFKEIVPVENIYVNTNDAYIDLVLEQLPDLAPDHLLAEPIHRGTAPSVAWCAHRIIAHNPDANIVIAPSDQTIIGEEAFAECISRGFDFVANNRFYAHARLEAYATRAGLRIYTDGRQGGGRRVQGAVVHREA